MRSPMGFALANVSGLCTWRRGLAWLLYLIDGRPSQGRHNGLQAATLLERRGDAMYRVL